MGHFLLLNGGGVCRRFDCSKAGIARIAKHCQHCVPYRDRSAPAECMTVPCRDALPSRDDGSKFGVSAGLDK
jgi:hypothetical protein